MTLDRFPGAASASWFDPTTGDTRAASGMPLSPRGEPIYIPASQNVAGNADRVLVIETP